MRANRHVITMVSSVVKESKPQHAQYRKAKVSTQKPLLMMLNQTITLTHIFLDYFLLGVPQFHDD